MDEWMQERFDLAKERVREIMEEKDVAKPYREFFNHTAAFLCLVLEECEDIKGRSLEELQTLNHKLYEDILPENYASSYGNPTYAAEALGEYGPLFTFLYAELRGIIVYVYEKKWWDVVVSLELFLEVYAAFRDEKLP
ncbi:MAG: leucyl aminopeptidase, partial [Blautia sp.]|nr:leucyl aminopeptidase [Blautia sp.]